MHIYAFGSVCRGDVSLGSDIDLLAIVDKFDARFSSDLYSIYSYERIVQIWQEGNPFAWHLHLESCLLFASDECDFLRTLSDPKPYKSCSRDCERFYALFREACDSLSSGSSAEVFELSTIFLSIRNFATCFSLAMMDYPCFARNSAMRLGDNSIPTSNRVFDIFERARLLSTRGFGARIENSDIESAILSTQLIDNWMIRLLQEVKRYDNVQ